MDDNRIKMLSELLVEGDDALMRVIVKHREDKGISLREVDDRCGWAPGTAVLFEHYAANPTLAEIRRYALAVGVRIRHEVIDFEGV